MNIKAILVTAFFTVFIASNCTTTTQKEKEVISSYTDPIEIIEQTNSIDSNGNFIGEVLDRSNKKTTATITLLVDSSSYIFHNEETHIQGSFNWVDEEKTIIELDGLDESHPNRFLVTSKTITQLLNGNILQDVNGNNLFVLSLQ